MQNPAPNASMEEILSRGPSKQPAGSALFQHPHCHKLINLICIQSHSLETRSQLFYLDSIASVTILTLKLHDD